MVLLDVVRKGKPLPSFGKVLSIKITNVGTHKEVEVFC